MQPLPWSWRAMCPLLVLPNVGMLANLLAAQIARISTRLQSGEMEFIIPGMPGFYLMLVLGPMILKLQAGG